MNRSLLFVFIFIIIPFNGESASPDDKSYGDFIAALPIGLTEVLAMKDAPNKTGAMGRNKRQYIHVRFQLGIHNIAHYALAAQDIKPLKYFSKAVNYSFEHQLPSGEFKIDLPDELGQKGQPSEADLVSGVAFFASSLGTGWLALESSNWFQNHDKLAAYRRQLEGLKPQLKSMLGYLKNNQEKLEYVDQKAPNRLLFNALAYYTLGQILHDESAQSIATQFINKALAQVHHSGYFIEGDGHDSSYNGVATALLYRLILMGVEVPNLSEVGARALSWQVSRIDSKGEISTEGNSRVNPNGNGESFMDRKKDVDVGHTLELLILAYLESKDEKYHNLATLLIENYSAKQ